MSYNDTANIGTLLGSLYSKAAQNNSFYKDTSNNLNGLYLCRGDVATDMCQKCVEAAIQAIQQPSFCQSNNWAIIWYDECMLRYSVDDFFGTVELDPQVWMWNVKNTTSPIDPNVQALNVMYNLTANVQTEPMMYAHGGGTQKGYGMVQCTRDISGQVCSANCLANLMTVAQKCCQGYIGWRLLALSCNLRYENYSFLTLPVPPRVPLPGPPPPPTTTSKGKIVLIITVPLSTFLVVAFGFYFTDYLAEEAKHEKFFKG